MPSLHWGLPTLPPPAPPKPPVPVVPAVPVDAPPPSFDSALTEFPHPGTTNKNAPATTHASTAMKNDVDLDDGCM